MSENPQVNNVQYQGAGYKHLPYVIDKHMLITKTNKDGVITYANNNFLKSVKYQKKELLGKTHNIIRHPSTSDFQIQELWQTITQGKDYSCIMANRCSDGSDVYYQTIIYPTFDENTGEVVEYTAIRNDITSLYHKSLYYEKMLTYDSVTGIDNLFALNSFLKENVENEVYLALLDINGFSSLNNSFGHNVGDILINQIAKRLKNSFGHSSIFRQSGDVFAIARVRDAAEYACNLERFIENITKTAKDTFESPFKIANYEHYLEFTIGISGGKGNTDLIRECEIALSSAKTNKEFYVVYNPFLKQSLENDYKNNKENFQKLKKAIKTDCIVPYFQPILNNKTNQVEKYECLARLTYATGETMPPNIFFEIAKKHGKYEEVSRIVMQKAFNYFQDKDVGLTINISFKDLASEVTRKMLLDNIANSKNPEKITLELLEDEEYIIFITTETSIKYVDRDVKIANFIKNLRKMGCKIAIDDFGSGYSNFDRLSKLGVIDILKIDGSLIRQLSDNDHTYYIVEHIVSLAKKLNLQTIAEFVSTKELQAIVTSLGIDYSQGWYIGQAQKEIQKG